MQNRDKPVGKESVTLLYSPQIFYKEDMYR